MADMESKIRKIVRGILVEGSCSCEGCQEIITQRILALIAADRAGLVSVLQEARDTLYQMYRHELLAEEYSYDMNFFEECGKRAAQAPILAKIDSALKERVEKLDKYKEKNVNNIPYTDHDGNKRIDKCKSYMLEGLE